MREGARTRARVQEREREREREKREKKRERGHARLGGRERRSQSTRKGACLGEIPNWEKNRERE